MTACSLTVEVTRDRASVGEFGARRAVERENDPLLRGVLKRIDAVEMRCGRDLLAVR